MSSLWSSLWSSLESSIRSSFEPPRWSSLWSSLESSLKSSIRSSFEPPRWSSLTPRWSSLESSLWSFYGFLSWDIYCQFNENEKIKNFVKYLPEAYKEGLGFAVITDKKFYALPMPKYHLNRQNQLHKDLSPAVIWADGEKEYWLNGVRCPEQVVMTIAEEINPKILLKENNAEVRREIVRKIGVERVCQKLNARIIDKYVCKERFPVIKEHYDERNNKWGAKIEDYCYREIEYELLLLCLGKDRSRPYLKMLNPSMGIYHIEGVPPNIQTVKKALEWRNNSNEEPNILT